MREVIALVYAPEFCSADSMTLAASDLLIENLLLLLLRRRRQILLQTQARSVYALQPRLPSSHADHPIPTAQHGARVERNVPAQSITNRRKLAAKRRAHRCRVRCRGRERRRSALEERLTTGFRKWLEEFKRPGRSNMRARRRR
jgi:hypothetical protein